MPITWPAVRMKSPRARKTMWWKDELCRESIMALIDLLKHELPPHRFEWSVERHEINGHWVIAVAFLYIDCELNPGGIAVHLISEELYVQALRCAGSRGG